VSGWRITHVNRGRPTPGVDGERLPTPDERAKLVDDLRPSQPWNATPVRRVSLPQANGKQRPLGIPTMRDRVRPRVVQHALAPRFAAEFDAHSDGFRPGRCGQEAIEAVSVALTNGARGHDCDILDADIPGALDHRSHHCLLHRLGPMPGRELSKQGLQAGYWAYGTRHHTTAGTPQGGVRSPLLAHSALEGLAKRLGKGYRVARYADDLRHERMRGGYIMSQ
jgi:RNA-directed DNA polymerase